MMLQPQPRLDHINDALSLIPSQFKGGPVIEGMIRAYATQIQKLEFVLIELWWSRAIDTATNTALDRIGLIVVERRDGQNDEEYRTRIKTKIAILRSRGRVNDLLAILASVADLDYTITELQPASIVITIGDNIAIGAVVSDIIRRARASGVDYSLVFISNHSDEALTLAEDDTTINDPVRGLADDALALGGYTTRYER